MRSVCPDRSNGLSRSAVAAELGSHLPGRMFANSGRARAHSHGHAHGYYHGQKKHIIGIAQCPWLQSRARPLYFGRAHDSFHGRTRN